MTLRRRESDQRAGNEIEIATGREADALKKNSPLSEGRAMWRVGEDLKSLCWLSQGGMSVRVWAEHILPSWTHTDLWLGTTKPSTLHIYISGKLSLQIITPLYKREHTALGVWKLGGYNTSLFSYITRLQSNWESLIFTETRECAFQWHDFLIQSELFLHINSTYNRPTKNG